MATVNLGSIKFNWQGAYNGATAYAVDDVVSSSGSSYICIAATTGNAPPNATYWEQMSSAGTDGTDLTTTLTTQGDLVYYNGSALARLGAGTSGQLLQTGGTGANPSWTDLSANAGTKSFLAYYDTNSSELTSGNNIELAFNAEKVDDDNVYNTANGRYTPGVVGTYFVHTSVTVNDINGAGDDFYTKILVNGTTAGYQNGSTRFSGNGASFNVGSTSAVIKLTSVTDYISVFVYQDAGTSRFAQSGQSHFTGFRLA